MRKDRNTSHNDDIWINSGLCTVLLFYTLPHLVFLPTAVPCTVTLGIQDWCGTGGQKHHAIKSDGESEKSLHSHGGCWTVFSAVCVCVQGSFWSPGSQLQSRCGRRSTAPVPARLNLQMGPIQPQSRHLWSPPLALTQVHTLLNALLDRFSYSKSHCHSCHSMVL